MMQRIKEDLFTIHGLITSVLHVAFVVGAITTWVLFQSEVLGNDPTGFPLPASPDKPTYQRTR